MDSRINNSSMPACRNSGHTTLATHNNGSLAPASRQSGCPMSTSGHNGSPTPGNRHDGSQPPTARRNGDSPTLHSLSDGPRTSVRRRVCSRILGVVFLIALFTAPAVRAQFAVIDVGAITQLIAQVELLQDELTTARAHLQQAQTEFASITGGRGMEQLLRGAPRNYLPTSWADLQAVMQGGGGFGGLAGGVAATLAINSILPDPSLALLPPDVRKQIQERRLLTALQQNLTRQALQTTSERFDSLQQLIAAIPAAADQKAVLDLQARIASENAMLLNEQSKLRALTEVVQAQELANQQQMRERAALGHGQFAERFQPVP